MASTAAGSIRALIHGPRAQGPWTQAIRLAFRATFGLVLAAALAWPFTNITEVQPDSRAVVLRLGRVVRVQGAGLLLAWPRPFERIVLLPSAERQIEFSFDPLRSPSGPGGTSTEWAVQADPRQNAAFFMTSDGVVHLTASVFYHIVDPAEYVLETGRVPAALKALTMASVVALAAARDTDTLVVTRGGTDLTQADRMRRERLRIDLASAINRQLAELRRLDAGLGVEISRVDVGTALPSGAKAAFEEVLTAAQQADSLVAEAHSVAIRIEQTAQQNRTALLAEARASADGRVAAAIARTASIRTLARPAGGLAGLALLTGIYNDRMRAILHQAGSVDVFDPHSGTWLVLPGQTAR